MTGHIDKIASDFVLGILPPDETRAVVDHVALCAMCRLRITQERKFAAAIRQSIELASRPDTRRINALMPTPRTTQPFFAVLRRQLIVAVLLMIICVSVARFISGAYLDPVNTPQSTALVTLTNFAATPPASITSTVEDARGARSRSQNLDSQQMILPAYGAPVPSPVTPAPAALPQPPG